MVPAAYRELLGIQGVRLPVIGAAIGRLPLGSELLAVLFLVQAATGSFAAAGAVEACFSIGAAVGLAAAGPARRPRRTDARVAAGRGRQLRLPGAARPGRRRRRVGCHPGPARRPGGLSIPSLSACMRSLWGTLVDDPHCCQSAYALDAVVLELAFIVGPLLAAGVSRDGLAERRRARRWQRWRSRGPSSSAPPERPALGARLQGRRHWAGPLRAPGIWVLGAAVDRVRLRQRRPGAGADRLRRGARDHRDRGPCSSPSRRSPA